MPPEDDTSPETPSAKRRFSANQAGHLVRLLQVTIDRISTLERSMISLQCRIDRSIESVSLRERMKEIQDDCIKQLEWFIESLDDDDRPSQTIILNTPSRTKSDSLKPKKEKITQLVVLIVTAVAAFFMALKESGIIK
jgi:hypothetical protein